MGNPKLRWPIDLSFHTHNEEQLLLIRCPLGITTEPLILIAATAPILQSLDGTLSAEQLIQKHSGIGLNQSVLTELLKLLEKHYFLEGERFDDRKKMLQQEYLSLDTRPLALQGSAYPLDQKTLKEDLQRYLKFGKQKRSAEHLQALIAPHIDYNRGKIVYGSAYAELQGSKHNVYVLLGTSHQYSKQMFHLTQMNFSSPFGTFPNCRAMTDQVVQNYGTERALKDEFLHKQEHSLELQLPFLALANHQAEIFPILIGSFHHMLRGERYPTEYPEYDEFVAAMAEACSQAIDNGKRICFIAGVDMAHMGASFGDNPGELTPEALTKIEERDREYLNAIIEEDPRKLFDHIRSDLDKRRICGFPSCFLLLDLLKRLNSNGSWNLGDYQQAIDAQRECLVSFASLARHSVA